MDLQAQGAALEAEVSRLRASQGVVTAPFCVQSPDGKTLVEIGINDAGRAEIQLFDPSGFPVFKLLSEEGRGALLVHGVSFVSGVYLRSNERGGEIELSGNDSQSVISLTTRPDGGRLELSHANGNSGVELGAQDFGPEPALRLYHECEDIVAFLGAGTEGEGRLQLLDADG